MEKKTCSFLAFFVLKKVLLLLVFSVFLADGAEKSVNFRAGKILSAEVSSKKPAIASDRQRDTANGVWAQVVVRLNPGRTIGTGDYVLAADGREFPCRAVALDDAAYDASRWEWKEPGEAKCRLLFNPARPDDGKTFEYQLKVKLIESSYNPPAIFFTDKKDDGFTEVSKIPDDGMLEEKPAAQPAEK